MIMALAHEVYFLDLQLSGITVIFVGFDQDKDRRRVYMSRSQLYKHRTGFYKKRLPI